MIGYFARNMLTRLVCVQLWS